MLKASLRVLQTFHQEGCMWKDQKHSYRKTLLYNWTRKIILFKNWLGWNPESLTPFRMGFHNFPSFYPDLLSNEQQFLEQLHLTGKLPPKVFLLRPRKRGEGPLMHILGTAGRHLGSGHETPIFLGEAEGLQTLRYSYQQETQVRMPSVSVSEALRSFCRSSFSDGHIWS